MRNKNQQHINGQLIEYNYDYSKTSGNLCNYYRDQIDYICDASDGKSYEYKTKIIGNSLARSSRPAQSPPPDGTQLP